jgi:hypothetical protein
MAHPGTFAFRCNAFAAWAFRPASLHGLMSSTVAFILPSYLVVAGIAAGSLVPVTKVTFSKLIITGVANGSLVSSELISSSGCVASIVSDDSVTVGSIRGI